MFLELIAQSYCALLVLKQVTVIFTEPCVCLVVFFENYKITLTSAPHLESAALPWIAELRERL